MSQGVKLTLTSQPGSPNDFTIKLDKAIRLLDLNNWLIGIEKIEYETNWLVLPDEQFIEFVYYDNTEKKLKTTSKYTIPAGSYTSTQLIECIQKVFKSLSTKKNAVLDYIKLVQPATELSEYKITTEPEIYLNNGQVVYITGVMDWYSLIFPRFSTELANIIGISSQIIDRCANTIASVYLNKGQECSDREILFGNLVLEAGLESFYVTTNISQTNDLINQGTSVLRKIHVSQSDSKFKVQRFNDIEFSPIKVDRSQINFIWFDLQTINVKLCKNIKGDLLPYNKNNSSITEITLLLKYTGDKTFPLCYIDHELKTEEGRSKGATECIYKQIYDTIKLIVL